MANYLKRFVASDKRNYRRYAKTSSALNIDLCRLSCDNESADDYIIYCTDGDIAKKLTLHRHVANTYSAPHLWRGALLTYGRKMDRTLV